MATQVGGDSGGSSGGYKSPTYWTSVLLNGTTLNMTTRYGKPGDWKAGYHTGTDYGVKVGVSVRSPVAGKVTWSGYDKSYGNSVVVRTSDGYYVRYAHLSSRGLKVGARVAAGTYVGKSGETGRTFGAHLHVEVMKPNSGGRYGVHNFVDPVAFFNGHATAATDSGKATGTAESGRSATQPHSGTPGTAGNPINTSSTTVSSNTVQGGGDGTVAGWTRADYYKWLDGNFGSIAALREMDRAARKELGGKSIDWLVDTLADKKIIDPTIIASYMAKTGWFKKYGEEASRRLVAERTRPKLFAEEVAKNSATVQAQLGALGITLSKDVLKKVARDSYIYGWDVLRTVDEAQKSFATKGAVTYDGGEIGEAQDALEQAAWELGVKVSSADIDGMRRDVVDGKGYQSTLDDLRERSATTYAIYGDQIRSGKSLRQVAGAYFQAAAEMLELGSPDQVEMDDPLFEGGKAFTTVDPTTGKQVARGLWDFQKDIRKDSRWLETGNARDAMFKTTSGILNMMGMS